MSNSTFKTVLCFLLTIATSMVTLQQLDLHTSKDFLGTNNNLRDLSLVIAAVAGITALWNKEGLNKLEQIAYLILIVVWTYFLVFAYGYAGWTFWRVYFQIFN